MNENVVKVKMWQTTIGYIVWNSKQKVAVFEYEPDFIKKGIDIAPLTMSTNSPRSQKNMPWMGNTDKLYQGLPPMIADSLPDKWGNSLFNAWISENKVPAAKATPVDHLSFIGSRAMGALEFEPQSDLGDNSAFDVNVQKLYESAKKVLSEREAITLNKEDAILWHDLIKISSSPGGKRPKAIVAINKATGETKSGQSDAPDGFEHYILKYDDNSLYPFAKLEYVYYKMAIACGINMMPSELRTYEGITHFLTKRFDRDGNKRIHVQTLAAMEPLSDSYEDIFTVMRKLNLPYDDMRQQYIRMVFNVLTRNVDDHSKNFAFTMTPNGVWRLSPAYDLTYSVDQTAPAYMNGHSLTVNGKDADITLTDLEKIALDNDIYEYKTLISDVKKAAEQFEVLALDASIDPNIIKKIQSDFIKI